MIGRESPNTAFIQSGIEMMVSPISISKGKVSITMNNSTSQGVRKSWVTNQQNFLSGAIREICPNPSRTPAAVPMAMVKKLISKFITNPLPTMKGSQRQRTSKASARLNFDCAAATEGMSRVNTAMIIITMGDAETIHRLKRKSPVWPDACPLNGKRTGKSVLVLPGPNPGIGVLKIFMNRIRNIHCAFPTLHTKNQNADQNDVNHKEQKHTGIHRGRVIVVDANHLVKKFRNGNDQRLGCGFYQVDEIVVQGR